MIAALRDESAEAPSEVQARNANLTFIKLDGNVGCCVNGAGLAMATMDLVKYYGGEPANLDALSQIDFWIQPSAPGGADTGQDCAWLGRPVDSREQLEQFAGALAGLGAELRIVRAEQPDPGPRALQFLADLAG